MEPVESEQHAGLRQLFVVLHHRGNDLLVREDARLDLLVARDHQDHESHSCLLVVGSGASGRWRPDGNPRSNCTSNEAPRNRHAAPPAWRRPGATGPPEGYRSPGAAMAKGE